jgi:hypothetical protein
MHLLAYVVSLFISISLAVAQVDCSSADCNSVEAETCYAAGMGNSMTNILRCITMPGETQADALRKVRVSYLIRGELLLTLSSFVRVTLAPTRLYNGLCRAAINVTLRFLD